MWKININSGLEMKGKRKKDNEIILNIWMVLIESEQLNWVLQNGEKLKKKIKNKGKELQIWEQNLNVFIEWWGRQF